MATDFKQILGVELETLGQIKETIKGLKEELQQYTVGSEQYLKVNTELQAEQKKLKAAMHIVKEETDLSKMSFNELNSQLASLKEAWKATANEAERGRLTTEINNVKAAINGMNHSIGNFQDQVGNYSKGVEDAFKNMGISVTSLTAPLKKIGVDMEGVDTTLKLLLGSMKIFSGQSLELISKGFNAVTSGANAFIKSLNGIKTAILATGIGVLVAALGTMIVYWDDIKEAIGKTETPMDILIQQTNDLFDSLSDARSEMEQTAKIMSALGASELEVAAFRAATLHDQLNQVNAQLTEQETELERLNTWWVRIGRAVLSVLQYVIPVSDTMREMFGLNGESKKLEESIANTKDQQKELNDLYSSASLAEYFALNKEDTKTQETKVTALRQTKELIDSQVDIGSVLREQADAEKEVLDGLQKALDLQQAEIDKRKTAMELEVEDYEQKKALLEEYHLSTEELTANHEEKMADLRAEVEQAEYEELLRQRDAEKAIDEERTKEYEKLMKARQTATQNMASGTVGIMKQVSKAMGESTKMGKGFAIAAATIDTIASAVSGFRAGMNQWADAGPMAWMAPVQAALNATMALVAGFAEVQQIKSVDTSGNSGGGSTGAVALAIPNIEGLSSPVDYTRQVTTETEKEEMNQNNRVYILESDIQQSNNRVRVREEETTF